MWIEAEDGQLINMAHVERIYRNGDEVMVSVGGIIGHRLALSNRPIDLMRDIANCIAAGSTLIRPRELVEE